MPVAIPIGITNADAFLISYLKQLFPFFSGNNNLLSLLCFVYHSLSAGMCICLDTACRIKSKLSVKTLVAKLFNIFKKLHVCKKNN